MQDSNTLPEGKILDSIYLTACAEPCRLEDMSIEEPAVWTRTHTVWLRGKAKLREAGTKVGGLLRSWREHRRRKPESYKRGVRVWGQPESTMDENICALLTQTDQEDAVTHEASQSILQVDLFGGEHTAYSRDLKWLAYQPQASIGPKQTAKVQVTDIRFARCGKIKQAELKPTLRKAVRAASQRAGRAAMMQT